jgi:hypothetical protein
MFAIAERHHGNVLVGKRQFNDALDGDTVVG